MSKTLKKDKNGSVFWAFMLAFLGMFFLLIMLFSKKANVKRQVHKVFKKEAEGVEELNERQSKVLKLLKERREITVEELVMEIKGVSERTFRRDMKKFEEEGLLKKEGNTKGSKYIFTE